MFEITYRFQSEACFYGHYTGIFFSEAEWKAFANDCKTDGDPVTALNAVKVNPMEWYKKAVNSQEYEWPYIVEIMGIAIMGQEWANQFTKWADMEDALKELGII